MPKNNRKMIAKKLNVSDLEALPSASKFIEPEKPEISMKDSACDEPEKPGFSIKDSACLGENVESASVEPLCTALKAEALESRVCSSHISPADLEQVPSTECQSVEPAPEESPCHSAATSGAEAELDTQPAAAAKGGGNWASFPVEKWRSAVYVNRAYFGDLCTDTTDFIVRCAEQIKLGGRRVSLVEVGCGTGEFIRETSDHFRVAVGLDFNPQFIEYCNGNIPKGKESQQRYVQGDACKLVDLMTEHFPPNEGLLWDDVRVVACVGNTIGIIPSDLKDKVYNQMLELAGPSGILIMVYWNARWFGDAVQNFYNANPQLCGNFSGESIDVSTTTLKTPSGYCTHWTSVEEARGVMERLGCEIISIKDKGKGVLVAARKLPVQDAMLFNPLPRAQTSGVWYCSELLESDLSSEDEGGTAKEVKPKAGGNWAEFPVDQWRSAVYINRAYFAELCTDTADFIVNFAEQIKLGGRRVSLIEVGCGTGEFIRDCADAFRVAVGVDFNPQFISYCNAHIPKGRQGRQRYIQGDACMLVDLMKEHFPAEQGPLWGDVRIVACVGNTIGIIPRELKQKVYQQMLDLAGPDGVLIMVYWNARWFGDAVQNFYHANPQLCGTFHGESIDLSTTTLKTPSGYCTHWTCVEEARAVMESLGVEIISIKDQGKGVLVAARKLPPLAQAAGLWYCPEPFQTESSDGEDSLSA